MARPYQPWNHQLETQYGTFERPASTSPRQISVGSSTSSRSHSVSPGASPIQTRSDGCPFSPGLVIERSPSTSTSASPRIDDDLVLVVVRVSSRCDPEVTDELPARPPKRTFLHRLSTRFLAASDANDHKVIRMPRGDYRRHFARDAERRYAGTEPEREWSAEDLRRGFGQYQETPLGNMPSC
ncbi:hypothetical protein B0A55_10146 [Friedmanniomyces simplex]|uniref:Uncharacterized protein n=1 Tax=Friedmanniomyces simplex TaxID=329884 RepID=A0A4U0WL64_9PEZI|nr:hypothetical protein B0A55_10146 [Friedmanniomyces simplex]